MEQRGWIRGAWETSQSGRRKRCYRLTPAGKKKLSPLRKEWAERFGALKRLTKVAHAWLARSCSQAALRPQTRFGREGRSLSGTSRALGRIVRMVANQGSAGK